MTSASETLTEERMLLMGMVKMDPPTETSMPSMMAMVRGIFRVVVMPLPHSLVMVTVPPTSPTFFFTTSMPTPLPENSVTSVLVEKPGIMRKLRISFWLYSWSGSARPWRMALLSTA